MLHHFITAIADWYAGALQAYGSPAVGAMMALESTIVPIPSELIIPLAVHNVQTGKVAMSYSNIIAAGTIGSWLGATIMYWAARIAGRPFFLRYGKLFLIPPQKIEGAERWAAHYGAMGIFISRLLPVVRHLIGIPAGIVRMDYLRFSLYTLLGSGIWCAVLCWISIKAGQDEQLMRGELNRVTLWIAGTMLALGGLYYFFVHHHMKKKS
jgi:membrane protein DedA with SNARE-associated domain